MKKISIIRKYPAAMRLTDWSCVVVLALIQLTSSAQPQKNIQFHHFSEEHKLPSHSYSSILQDKKGYIWFGTDWHGLIKYDGYTFKFFNQDPFDLNSLGSPNTRSLCNDIHGNVWIAGEGGVSKYDPHKENFIPYWYDWYGPQHKLEISHQSEYIAALPTSTITCVVGDEMGRLWIGTAKGLCFLDSSSAKIVNLSDIISPDTLSNLWINCLMLDHNRSLWIGTKNGINIYDRVSKKIKLFDPPDKNFAAINKDAVCILEDHSGRIWIGSPNNGIYRYDPSTGNSKIYRHSASDKNSLPSDEVTSLMEDSHHTIWIGTNEGVSVYQPGSDNFETYLNDANDKNSLNWKQVANLFEDQSGVLWIGMSSTGIRGYYPTEKKFILYPYRDKDQASHSPTGIYKDRSGNIYMTTFGSGVQEFNPVTEKFKSYMSFPEGKLTALNYYFGAFESSDGTLWLLGIHEGLHQLDRKIGKITTIYSKHGDVSTCMAEDLDKRLWIGANGGLKCYDLKTKKYSTAQELYPSTPELEFAHSFGDLYCDKNGILWIGGNSGLVILNTKTGKAKSFVQDPENLNSISSNGIYCFYDDENGHIWIGTSWGLNRFDKKTEQFVWYTVKDGLPDNNVVSILADESGHLWLSTEKGICQFTPPSSDKKVVCRNYDRSDGLPSEGFGRALKGNDGTFYFSCLAGIVAFKPGELKDNPYLPPVLITDFNVHNKPVVPNDSTGILKLPADETREIKLSYRQNDFSFTFTALSYIHPEKNQYAYKLEDFDKEWTYTDATKRFATYTNIDPGEYIFRVKASNNDGVWNEEGTSIKLVITPPYWQTSWFKLICILAAGLILYWIYYNRLQKIRDIRRIRNKIASDLHDDLGATLSSISIMSELVNQQVKDKSSQASTLLEKIGTSSRNMIESVNDMVWAINPQNDSFENIIKRMRTFASEILAAKDIAFHFDFDKNLVQSKLKMDIRRNFYLIFKEAVNNAAKYSQASNTYVMIWNRENNLKMTIRDDGSGFEMKTVKAGNGLANMQHRAELMKARFILESFPGKGTIVELEFKNE